MGKVRHNTHTYASRRIAPCIMFLPPAPHKAPSIPLKGRKVSGGTLFLAISHIASEMLTYCHAPAHSCSRAIPCEDRALTIRGFPRPAPPPHRCKVFLGMDDTGLSLYLTQRAQRRNRNGNGNHPPPPSLRSSSPCLRGTVG